ncbi:MAG: SecE/Sec61-gamma subunit of protein translocation complex [Verrucomicrobiota bacterium]|jgi:preprotein translocase SecE subunit
MNNPLRKVSRYATDVTEELRRCTWPSGKEVISSTVLVLAVGAALALFIMGADFFLGNLIQAI